MGGLPLLRRGDAFFYRPADFCRKWRAGLAFLRMALEAWELPIDLYLFQGLAVADGIVYDLLSFESAWDGTFW